MNASPARVRLLRDGSHCHCCSSWEIRVYDEEAVKDKAHPAIYRVGRVLRRDRAKPKGQHAYRRGLVALHG
jgi:hypothetical protein